MIKSIKAMKLELSKFKKYGDLNTHDLFKFFAISFMIIDHIGMYLWDLSIFRVIGRLSFPIFAVIYGYHFKDKISPKLAIWGAPLLFIDFYIKKTIFPLNILFSFMIGGYLIKLYGKNKYRMKQWDKKILFGLILLLHFYLIFLFEYGSFIILFMVCSYLFKHEEIENRFILTLLIFWCYFFEQSLKFKFGFGYLIIFALGLAFVYIKLKEYKLKPYSEVQNPALKNIIKFMARYSMQIYAIHLAIFKLIAFYFNSN